MSVKMDANRMDFIVVQSLYSRTPRVRKVVVSVNGKAISNNDAKRVSTILAVKCSETLEVLGECNS
jgi:hypothetical protein